jgi:adenylate cyclase
VSGTRDVVVQAATANATTLVLGDRTVPLDGKGNLLLRFRGEKQTFPYLSAADVLAGRVGSEALSGKIVLVGTTALGTREVVATPLDTLFVGVEVQATTIDNLLQGDFIRRPEQRGAIEGALTMASGGAVTLLMATRSVALGTALAGGALALFIAWRRQRLTATVERTAALVRTGGGNVADIERPTENNRFAYAPAIAIGTLAAVLGL